MIARVYAAICAVTSELARSGICKSQTNQEDQYQFRGIDDVYNRLAPLLAQQRLCILPRILERTSQDRMSKEGALLLSVSIKAAFDIVSAEDGSVHTIEAYGEALDGGDKGTAKAMTAAYKYALIQAFCIPVRGSEDADASSHQLRAADEPDPVQGWDQWSNDVSEVVQACESDEALDRLQALNRAVLRAASRRRPDLYTAIGERIRERRLALKPKRRPSKANGRKAPIQERAEEAAHA